MDAGARRERARADTHGFQDIRRGLSVAVSGGIVAFAGIAATDSVKAAGTELWIVLLTILGAFVVRPLVEFAWNYAWTPWRVLCEQVESLSNRPAAVATAAPSQKSKANSNTDPQQFQAIHARLRALRPIEGELRKMRKGAAKALEADKRWEFSYSNSWSSWSDLVGSVPDWKDLFDALRESYEELADSRLSSINDYRNPPDDWRERLEAALPIFDKALGAIDAEIDRLTRLAQR